MSNHASAPSYTGHVDMQATGHAQPLSYTRTIAAITIGNGLEFYDFVVYNFFATLIGWLYFPVDSTTGWLLMSFTTSGVGFLMRPPGGPLIGMHTDRAGRKSAMVPALWPMGLSLLIFVTAPTYAQIGISVPTFAVLTRLVQGFAIDDEAGASTVLLLEYTDDRSRGFYTSQQPFSQGLAALSGALVGLLLSNALAPPALESWGQWLAFAIGIFVILVGLIIQRWLEEAVASPSTREANATLPLLREHHRTLVASILLMIGMASSTYIVVYYFSNYAVNMLHTPLSLGIWAACITTLVQVVLSPFTDRLADRVGRRKVVLWSRVALLAAIYLVFALISTDPSLIRLLIVVGCLSVPMSMTLPASTMLVSEVLSWRLRVMGLSIACCVAIVIFSGFAQSPSTELIDLTGNTNALAFYAIGCGLVSLIGLAMVPETLGCPLS